MPRKEAKKPQAYLIDMDQSQGLPYSWVEPLARPHHGWAAFRVLGVPAIVVGCAAWFSFPRIAAAMSFDRDLEVSLMILEVLGGFELLVLAMFALDRRKVTLDESGLTLAGAGGLLPGRAIALSTIGAVGVEGEPGAPSTLRLIPRGRGIKPEDATIGLGKNERNIQAVQDRFRMLGVTVEEPGPRAARSLRNPVLARVVIFGVIAWLNSGNLTGSSDSADDAVLTPAPVVLDPSIHCVVAQPGGLISIDVANVEQLVEVKVQSHTIGAREVRTERIGPSLARLTLHLPPAERSTFDEAESDETLTVFSRGADGSTHSGWFSFDRKNYHPQGYECS
jgi:hypothetical protein